MLSSTFPLGIYSKILTRVNIFFPEKRDFYLENAGLFSFGLPGQGGLTTEFQSNDVLNIFYESDFEHVPFEFSVLKSIKVQSGNFTTHHGGSSFQSKQGRRFSIGFNFETGGFYDGTKTNWSAILQWKENRHLTIFQDYDSKHKLFGRIVSNSCCSIVNQLCI